MNIFGPLADFIRAQNGAKMRIGDVYTSATPNVYQIPNNYSQQINQPVAQPQAQQGQPQMYGLDALAAFGNQIARGNRAPMQQSILQQAPAQQVQQAQAPQFDLQAALQNAMASRAAMQNTGVQVTGDALRRARAEMAPAEAGGYSSYDAGGGGDGGVGGGDDGSSDGDDGSGDGDGGDGDGGDGGGDGGGGDGGGGDGGGERAGGLIMNAAREKALKAYRRGELTFKELCKALA